MSFGCPTMFLLRARLHRRATDLPQNHAFAMQLLRNACLRSRDVARRLHATVHMPRIGCGQAGGSWFIVEELIASTLLASSVPAVVYDLAEREPIRPVQGALIPSMA